MAELVLGAIGLAVGFAALTETANTFLNKAHDIAHAREDADGVRKIVDNVRLLVRLIEALPQGLESIEPTLPPDIFQPLDQNCTGLKAELDRLTNILSTKTTGSLAQLRWKAVLGNKSRVKTLTEHLSQVQGSVIALLSVTGL
jgi:hypothetical protein